MVGVSLILGLGVGLGLVRGLLVGLFLGRGLWVWVNNLNPFPPSRCSWSLGGSHSWVVRGNR